MSTNFSGKVAVVTGAGSGIGRELAVELARRGARLALSDVDTTGLEETERLVRAVGADVRVDHLDVTQREAVFEYADTVAEHFGVVHQVYNNAGIAFHGDVEETDFKSFERVVDVDFWGVVNGTKAFLPHLVASGDGHIVNVSSLFGLLSIPGQAAYNAAKFAVRGFTEALRMEMLAAGHPVAVTCVHPGGIKTSIARNATAPEGKDVATMAAFFDKYLATTEPQAAAKKIVDGVAKKRARVLIGPDAIALDLMVRLVGPGYQRVTAFIANKFVPKG